jgi:hypothetical protein
MTIENYGKNKDYSCTTYWYAAAGATDFFTPVPVEQRGIAAKVVGSAGGKRVKGAFEGETLKLVGRNTTGECDPQELESFGLLWSNNSQMWFRPAKAGEWVELELPVAADGRYTVLIYGTKAGDYGIVQYALNGQAIGKPIDAYNNGVAPTGKVELGVVELKKGTTRLKMEVIGKSPQSAGFMAGLDCIVLEPAK